MNMEIENRFKYYAFISYKREDEQWAKWLQHKLEHYRLPSNLNGRTDLPREIRPIFRDQSDLAGGVLADKINDALECSKFLIVICSPRAAQSEWVGKEVQAFMDMGRADRIIPFIIGGTVNAQNPQEECFPLALRKLPTERELLGVNVGETGRDAAAVKVIAQMFGLQFDELWQRNEREQKKRQNRGITAGVLVLLAIVGIAFWMYTQWQQTLKANWKMMENQSRYIAEKANNLIEEGNPYTALRLLLEVLPIERQDKPCTVEAERAFRKANNFDLALLKGHTSFVSSTAFNSDGSRIVSASEDMTVRIWDVKTGTEIHQIKGCTLWVNPNTFSPDNKRIVLAPIDTINLNNVTIWNIETGKCIRTLKGHSGRVNSASFSPDGKYIVSTSQDSTLRIWDAETGEAIRVLRSCPEIEQIVSTAFDSTTRTLWKIGELWGIGVISINKKGCYFATFSPDNKYIVSEYLNTIIVWDTKTGKPIRILNEHTGMINSVSYSPDGEHIISASDDGTIKFWDTGTGDCIFTIQETLGPVCSAVFSHDGKYVVAAYYDGTDIIWDVETGKIIQSFKAHYNFDRSLAFSPDGKHIVSASNTAICIRSAGSIAKTIIPEEQPIEFYPVAFSPDGKRIVSLTGDTTIFIIDVETDRIVRKLDGHKDAVLSAIFSPDGKHIVSASEDKTVKIWNTETWKCIRTLNGHKDAVLSASFSPDGRRIVSTSADSTIRTWNAENGKELMKVKGHSGVVYSATFSPDGRLIVSRSEDRTTKVWDAITGSEIVSFEGPDDCYSFDETHSATFTLNEECIVAPSNNEETVNVWDIKTGKIIHTLKGNIWWVYPIVYTSEGERVVTTYGETVRVWDLETGAEIQRFQKNPGEHSDLLYAVFSPNGRQILSVDDDGTFCIWDFPPLQELIDQTRERFNNDTLTKEERRMYYLE